MIYKNPKSTLRFINKKILFDIRIMPRDYVESMRMMEMWIQRRTQFIFQIQIQRAKGSGSATLWRAPISGRLPFHRGRRRAGAPSRAPPTGPCSVYIKQIMYFCTRSYLWPVPETFGDLEWIWPQILTLNSEYFRIFRNLVNLILTLFRFSVKLWHYFEIWLHFKKKSPKVSGTGMRVL